MNAPGNATKLWTTHSNVQTAQSWTGQDRTHDALVSILLSQKVHFYDETLNFGVLGGP